MASSGSINLLKLEKACIINLNGKDGNPVQCAVIPVKENNIHIGEKGAYLGFVAVETPNNQFGQSHMLKPEIHKDVYQKMSEAERNAVPIIGGIKPIVPKEPEGNAEAAANYDTANLTPEQGDDLPF